MTTIPRNIITSSACLISSILIFSGCVATTTDIDQLADTLNTVQKSQADLITKLDELDSSLSALSEKLDSSQKSMSSVSSKLGDTQSNLTNRMEKISHLLTEATTQSTIQVPSDVYRSALGDYFANRTDLALTGFQSFLTKYPKSDLADDAQFYLADCYLIKKKYVQARKEFDKVLAKSTALRPQSLLKRSYALAGSNLVNDQKITLNTLIKEFPDSEESSTAKQILETLKSKKTSTKRKTSPKKKKSTK